MNWRTTLKFNTIDDAIKTMKERCENALQNYKRASGSLNLLESYHEITKKEHEQMLAQVAQSEILWETKKKGGKE